LIWNISAFRCEINTNFAFQLKIDSIYNGEFLFRGLFSQFRCLSKALSVFETAQYWLNLKKKSVWSRLIGSELPLFVFYFTQNYKIRSFFHAFFIFFHSKRICFRWFWDFISPELKFFRLFWSIFQLFSSDIPKKMPEIAGNFKVQHINLNLFSIKISFESGI